MNPANNQNWALVCSACGAEYANDEVIGLVDGHWQESGHVETHGEAPAFNLVWRGVGPAPESGPQRRSKRRRGRR